MDIWPSSDQNNCFQWFLESLNSLVYLLKSCLFITNIFEWTFISLAICAVPIKTTLFENLTLFSNQQKSLGQSVDLLHNLEASKELNGIKWSSSFLTLTLNINKVNENTYNLQQKLCFRWSSQYQNIRMWFEVCLYKKVIGWLKSRTV